MDATFWQDYRKTTGDLTWRLATKEDQAAIDAIRESSEKSLGEKQQDLNLFARPVLLALVAEDAHGVVVDAMYLEAQIEVRKVGCSPVALVETAGIESELYAWARGMGFKTVTIRTRKSLKEKMVAVLEYLGFECSDDKFSHWTRDL